MFVRFMLSSVLGLIFGVKMLRLLLLSAVLMMVLSACKKPSEPVKTDESESISAASGTKKSIAGEDPAFKIAEQSRKAMDDAKQLEEEVKKATDAQKKALEAQEKAIEEAK